jgi:DNA-binding response OmpR family regulator
MTTGRGGEDRPSSDKPHRARQGLVLVIAGDPRTQDSIRLTLQKEYELVSLTDGRGFIEAVEAYNPDLIILESGPPERLSDGYQMYRQLRARSGLQDIPVLFVGAMCADAAFMRSLVTHGDAYLTEPFSQRSLWDVATRLIASGF